MKLGGDMKNPCNEIKIGYNTTSSYNAGYHRGLNSEYHDVPIEALFKKWVEETDIRLVPVVFDPVAFEEGYNDGIEDYEVSLRVFGDEAATTAGWE